MKKRNIIYIFLLILPILDLLSSISSRFLGNFLSIGVIIKGLAIITGVFYILFKSRSKYRNISIFYLIAIFLFIVGYFLTKIDLLRFSFLFTEINYLFKFIYFPIMTFTFLNVFDEISFNEKKLNNIMLISLISYIVLIAIPTILNINFNSYSNLDYVGSVGWYYSANEISTILLLMFPFIFTLFEKRKVLLFLIFSICLYTISLIGTKVTLFGIIIIMFLIFISSLIKNKKLLNISVITTLILFIVTIGFMNNNYSALNMKNSLNQNEKIEINNIKDEIEDFLIETEKTENLLSTKIRETFLKLLSSRDLYAINTYKIYSESYNKTYPFFGIGFSNTSRVNNDGIEKLIESDVLDVFFHLGILAILILLFPFVYIIYLIMKNRKFNERIFILFFVILLTIGISTLAGHVYIAPAVSIYISIYFIYLFNEVNVFTKKEINKNKISILALHLGYGGVENVIASISSMLSEKYEVEIISLYKKEEEIPFKINNKVKIKYLLNFCSNKKEFKEAVKKFNIFAIFKEGVKAFYILINKNILIKKAILESDAQIIISTRFSFSKLLNKFGQNEVIKIHQEHTYNITDKYIRNLNKLHNIDYIMPVSKILFNIYNKKINIKMKYIELSLNEYPQSNELSKLNNKKLISIGRLEKEKCMIELVYIIKELIKFDKDIYLNIFGDGTERANLEDLIKKFELEEHIKLWGFQKQSVIKEVMKNSSLYLMTSLEESFGLVLIEAMSYGVPCIAYSSAEGAKDIIKQNSGFIIKKRNRKKYVKTIIDYFNSSSKDKKNYQKESRMISSLYKYDIIKEKWFIFIEEVLDEKVLKKNL